MQGLYEFVRFDIKAFLSDKVLRSVSCGPLTDYQSKEVIGTRVGVVITEDEISSLRRFKDDVKEVAAGYECGVGLQQYNDIHEGDIFETYILEEYRD